MTEKDKIELMRRFEPFGREIPKDQVMSVIARVPTTDRPKGEWFKDDKGTFICSVCGTGDKDQPTIMGKPMFVWCPFCGAEMRGEDE